jgi:hypothetical protein
MVSFRTVAEKMTKQELMDWSNHRLNLVLTKNMSKIEMGSKILTASRKQGVKMAQIKEEFDEIYHARTGKHLICVFNR